MYEATPLLEEADILIVCMGLPNGRAGDLLDEWVRETGGMPAVCLTGKDATHEEVNDLLDCAWNVLAMPFDEIHVLSVVERLAMVIRGANWGKEVLRLKRRMMTMWLVIAVLVAKEIGWPLVQGLLNLL